MGRWCTGRGKGDTGRAVKSAVETEQREGAEKERANERKEREGKGRKKELGKKGGKRYFSWLDNNKTNSKQATNKRETGQEDNGQFKP